MPLEADQLFEEMGGCATPEIIRNGRDSDACGAVCDHRLVVAHQPAGNSKVVGTYRQLRRDTMKPISTFYAEGEFEISAIPDYQVKHLTLGDPASIPAIAIAP